jgi:hypothetical protein
VLFQAAFALLAALLPLAEGLSIAATLWILAAGLVALVALNFADEIVILRMPSPAAAAPSVAEH